MDEYRAHAPSLAHLFDLFPPAPRHEAIVGDDPSGVSDLAAAVRTRTGRDTDVRLHAGAGDLAAELAANLHRDVYFVPPDAEVRYLRETSAIAGESWEAVAVDRGSGVPVEWSVARPPDLPPGLPTWFVSSRGGLRPNRGLVSLPLEGGIAFATRATYRDTAQVAARLRRLDDLTTVAVTAEYGRFEISRYDDDGALLGGAEFATLVAASLDVIAPDVQLALTWPTTPEACTELDGELARLAEQLDRTVWVPEPAGATAIQPGVGEFAAVDEVGEVGAWRAYPPGDQRPRHRSDLDGRLIPIGDVAVTAFPAAPLVSVPQEQLDRLRAWYESAAPLHGLFALDLAATWEGRLGVCLDGGGLAAVGPRELRRLLVDAGWSGADLLLLTQPPAEQWDVMAGHARNLIETLAVDIWLAAPGAEVWVRPDGSLEAEGPDGAGLAWRVLQYGLPSGADSMDVPLPPALAGVAVSVPAEVTQPEVPPAAPPVAAPATPSLPDSSVPAVAAPVEAAVQPAVAPARTARSAAAGPGPARPGAAHAVAWLPASAPLNGRALDLYLTSAVTGEHGWELPTPDLFLLAGDDALRLAERCRATAMVRVRVAAQCAIDLRGHVQYAPEHVRRRISEAGGTHLLPLAWHAGVRVSVRYDIDDHGAVSAGSPAGEDRLTVRFAGAEHGVAGLPNEVVRWPELRLRTEAPTYLVLGEGRDDPYGHLVRGYLPLFRRRPDIGEGQRLLEVRVRRRCAIDIAETLQRLSAMPVAGRLHDFAGLDLLLCEPDFGGAVVTKAWRSLGGRRLAVHKLDGAPLSDALAGAASSTRGTSVRA